MDISRQARRAEVHAELWYWFGEKLNNDQEHVWPCGARCDLRRGHRWAAKPTLG